MEIKNKTLQPYLEQILATKRDVVRLSFVDGEPSIFDSQLGGTPYWEDGNEYPLDKDGVPMFFLGQLNFSLLPNLSDLPKDGILQFFISATDGIFGLDFDEQTNQANFRIVFWGSPKLEKYIPAKIAYSFFSPDKHTLPLYSKVKLAGAFEDDYWGSVDEYVGNFLSVSADEKVEVLEDAIYEEEALSGTGHKIGGYAFFTQSDPRPYVKNSPDKHFNDTDNPWILLLQLDSETASWDNSIDLMWGDAGVANFFIRKNDLLNLDFSNVLYNWDCY